MDFDKRVEKRFRLAASKIVEYKGYKIEARQELNLGWVAFVASVYVDGTSEAEVIKKAKAVVDNLKEQE